MRLICPGCGAQYEVDDGIIPDAGRDVQCSACGQVWFQKSRPMLLSEEEAVALPLTAQDRHPGIEPPRAPLSSSDAVDQVISSAFAEDPDPELPETPSAPATRPQPRRALDESLLAILREEAEREARARRAESPALETQEEMNLTPAPTPPAPAVRVEQVPEDAPAVEPLPEEIVVETPAEPEPEPVTPPPRPEPEPLPDISALKASLRASADRNSAHVAQMAEQKRAGFRLGFVSVLAVAALATAIYGFAPELAEAVPDLDPALSAYVDQVNQGRVWLDEHLRSAMTVAQTALRG
ncbi:zinc-ribbon domain-containing protein [Paenirhodobacter populi]|nr:zinc-ribbon domain-containing protein [Sinirhodobacter populi]